MPDNRFLRQFDENMHAKYHVKLLGIRGYYKDMGASPGANDFGVYDDLIVRCIGNDTTGFQASCDPGWLSIRGENQGANPNGCALLCDGTHLFKRGKHSGHDALVQGETFYVKRLNKDGTLKPGKFTGSAINIHSGGNAVNDVGGYSAGCQVIYSPEGYFGKTWHRFFDDIATEMKDAGQTVVPYKLLFLDHMI